ncbi:MAG: hypothetical protein A2498_08540 [Lentisphaerae bacterium RIFOXYC12_FULL_60_16]|nr:MAG: hypothetical protein A2498_08540 [Lentisphaerae bacterium RIFOXYC12_FULL_60_16]OGV84974.1 MAG: hypothetical protein A2340_14305 [Lentisphaerae bacterium RIFOXYB12_FULL_60_10]
MTGIFFNVEDITAIPNRVVKHPWAKKGLEKIRSGLEARREDILPRNGQPLKAENPGTTLLELALCSRLLSGWYREAAETFLRNLEDPAPFMFKQAFDLCLGLDFLDGLDTTLRARLYERVLVPVGEKFMQMNHRGGNIQTTYNLSLLCIGLLTRRTDFIERVTSDPERGYPYQLANSIGADGFWYEQCPASYHGGSIERFLRLRWITLRHGLDMGGDEVIRRMLDTLPGMAMQGGILPLIGEVKGDSQPTLRKEWLELAYAMYETPWIGWALGRMDREGLWSLLIGRAIGASEAPEPRSRLFSDAGLCVLKTGERDAYWEGKGSGVTVTFGPHGDWHGHSGKLGIEYRRDDRHLVRDHGHSGGYANPIHRLWYMSTLAHSTVVLDERNQHFTWCNGRPEQDRREGGVCQAHLFRDDVSACTVSADFAYPGCRLKRTLFLTRNYLLDIFECTATDGSEHTFDWLLHTGGVIQTGLPFVHGSLECRNKGGAIPSPEGLPYAPGSMAPASYDYIREIEMLETADRWSLDIMNAKWAADVWKVQDRAMRLMMLGETGTRVFKGVCPATPAEIYNPVILVRRRARRTTFIALHVPGDQPHELECLRNEAGTIVCRVNGDGIGMHILVKQDQGKLLDVAGFQTTCLLDASIESSERIQNGNIGHTG